MASRDYQMRAREKKEGAATERESERGDSALDVITL